MAGTFLGSGTSTFSSTDTQTENITVPSGTDLLVIIGVRFKTAAGTTLAPTSITVAGNAATDVGETPTGDQNTGWQKMFYYLSPASGTNSIVATGGSAGASIQTGFMWVAYSGFAQTGQPDSHTKNDQAATTAMNVTTTVVADSWFIGSLANQGSVWVSSYTNATQRELSTPNAGCGIFDSNGTVNSGSQTMTVNQSMPFLINGIGASFALLASGPANLKSLDGNVLANIKSFDGNVIANVKSLSGNS